MKTYVTAACVFLMPLVSVAAEPEEATSPVWSLAPADALAIVYVDKPPALLQHAVLRETAVLPPEVGAFLKSAAEAFSGPTMIAVCGSPMDPASIRVELATSLPQTPQQEAGEAGVAFFKKLDEEILPPLAQWLPGSPSAGVGTSALLRTIRLPGPVPLTLFAAENDGIIFASSHRASAEAWLEGGELAPRFVDSDDYEQLRDATRPLPDLMVYANVRLLVSMAAAGFDRETQPGLFAMLGLDRVQAGLLSARWTSGSPRLRLAIGLGEGEPGLPAMLAPRNVPVGVTALLPPDYTFFVRGGFDSAASYVDQINDFLRLVDADIVDEFALERTEFRGDFGFDVQDDLLANMVDEWMIAGRIDAGGIRSPLAAIRLNDPAVFESQLGVLVQAFDLDFTEQTQGGVRIRSTPATAPYRMSMATVGDYLVVAREAETVREVAEAWSDKQSLQAAPAWRALARQLPAQTAQLGFINLGHLSRIMAAEIRQEGGGPEIIEPFELMSKSDTSLGLAVSAYPGLLVADAALSDKLAPEVTTAISKSVVASLERARELSRRTVSAANLYGTLNACMLYAGDHKKVWPESLSALVSGGYCSIQQLDSPYRDSAVMLTVDNVDRESYYLYRPGTGLGATDVVACERELRDGGANFGFADGHCQWIEGPEAENLLALMQRTSGR